MEQTFLPKGKNAHLKQTFGANNMKLRRITILPFPDTIYKKNRSTSFDKKRAAQGADLRCR
jgi:hypothetical protein